MNDHILMPRNLYTTSQYSILSITLTLLASIKNTLYSQCDRLLLSLLHAPLTTKLIDKRDMCTLREIGVVAFLDDFVRMLVSDVVE